VHDDAGAASLQCGRERAVAVIERNRFHAGTQPRRKRTRRIMIAACDDDADVAIVRKRFADVGAEVAIAAEHDDRRSIGAGSRSGGRLGLHVLPLELWFNTTPAPRE
jgi:hypothetical protein